MKFTIRPNASEPTLELYLREEDGIIYLGAREPGGEEIGFLLGISENSEITLYKDLADHEHMDLDAEGFPKIRYSGEPTTVRPKVGS